MYLIVYVDDIVITRNDVVKICQLKKHLCHHFQTKDLGSLKYFWGKEIAQSKEGVVFSQRKYALDILKETGMVDCKPVDCPMDPNLKLMADQGKVSSNLERYRRLVGKLISLTITRRLVGVVSQFMQNPCVDHWNVVIRILRYLKKTLGQGLLYKEDKGVPKFLDIVTLIGPVLLWINALPLGIEFFLEEMLSHGKEKTNSIIYRS